MLYIRLSSKEVAIVTRKANPAGTYRKLKRQGRPVSALVDIAGKEHYRGEYGKAESGEQHIVVSQASSILLASDRPHLARLPW